MKHIFFFTLLTLSSTNFLLGQNSRTYNVYVNSTETKCQQYSINLGGSLKLIFAKLAYELKKCNSTEYSKLKKEKIPINKEMILKGKSYIYDGAKVYPIDNISKTCGWPITVAEWLKLRGF